MLAFISLSRAFDYSQFHEWDLFLAGSLFSFFFFSNELLLLPIPLFRLKAARPLGTTDDVVDFPSNRYVYS